MSTVSFAGVPEAAGEGEEHDQKQAGGSTTRWRDGLGVHGEVYEEAIIWAFD